MDRWDDFRNPLDLGNWQNIERRIGVRVPAEGLEVRWVLPDEIDLRDEGFLGRVTEVSVTGAAITASSALPFEIACPAALRYGGCETIVTLRHPKPTGAAAVTVYGVEWGKLEEPLRHRIGFDAVHAQCNHELRSFSRCAFKPSFPFRSPRPPARSCSLRARDMRASFSTKPAAI
jgi:hypothetical protein